MSLEQITTQFEIEGEFQRQLADLPPPRLHETIPDFHHTPKRFATLAKAIKADAKNRAARAKAEIEFALRHESLCGALLNDGLPERVTHNDTKFNNVLLDDESGAGVVRFRRHGPQHDLQGDVYFKVHRDGHNLDRCRTQFKLVESITAQEAEMNRIVSRLG